MALPILSFGSIPPPTSSALPAFPTVVLPNPQDSPPSRVPTLASAKASKGPRTTTTLESSLNSPSSTPSPDPSLPDLKHLARTVLNAKKIAIVCGAGISTASGIPDFRSTSGLFESLKLKYPEAKLSSGKDLFDAGLFSSEQNASIFYNMIAELKKQTDEVEPTKFHHWLKSLDTEGKLFRVYTQNIDSLEERAGLSYGLGTTTSLPLPSRRPKQPKPLSKSRTPELSLPSTSQASSTASPLSLSRSDSTSSLSSLSSSSSSTFTPKYTSDILPLPSSSQTSSTPFSSSTIPRCIPLHGHLSTLSCYLCSTTYPLSPFLPLLQTGQPPYCPTCISTNTTRLENNRRSLGVGFLKPDVVLYNEHHKDGTRIGEITEKDLMGVRPDLLLVVGTSLKVPGTKKLVKEFSKVIKPTTPSPQEGGEGKGKGRQKKEKIQTIFLNKEFPGGGKEWQGVFDCWVRGDIQEFVEVLEKEKEVVLREKREKEEKKLGAAGMVGKGKGKEKEKEVGKVKVKGSKLPPRPKPTLASKPRTVTVTEQVPIVGKARTSKRATPPTPTKSPSKPVPSSKSFFVDVPPYPTTLSATTTAVPSPSKQQPSLKRPRKTCPPSITPRLSTNLPPLPSLPIPATLSDNSKSTTATARRSNRSSTTLSTQKSLELVEAREGAGPVKPRGGGVGVGTDVGSRGLGFGVTKKGLSGAGGKKT